MSRQIKKYIKTRCEKEKSNFKAEKINQEVKKGKNSFHIKIKKFFEVARFCATKGGFRTFNQKGKTRQLPEMRR